MAREFLPTVVEQRLLSGEHFSVDGTLLEAWASMKSFRPDDEDTSPGYGGRNPGRNPEVDFRGERRSNDPHRSTTGPESRLARKGKGKEARLCLGAHLLMDDREGLVVDLRVGTPEQDAALDMLAAVPGESQIPVGVDRGYDTSSLSEKQCSKLNSSI